MKLSRKGWSKSSQSEDDDGGNGIYREDDGIVFILTAAHVGQDQAPRIEFYTGKGDVPDHVCSQRGW